MFTRFQKDETLLFIGDSITDAGRTDHLPPYGEGYMAFFRLIMMARHPELQLRFMNRGIAANTLRGLSLRWREDVLKHAPAHLFIMTGINNAVKHLASARGSAELFSEFRDILRELLLRANNAGIPNIYLLSPFYISNTETEPLWKITRRYADIMKNLADRGDVIFLDMHAYFREKARTHHAGYWSDDGIHPLPHTHMLIAEKLYRELVDEN